MEVLDKLLWFSIDNSLTAGMQGFHAAICIHQVNKKIVFQVTITDEKMDELILSFPTLEEAFSFVQSIGKNCETLQDIASMCLENNNGKAPIIKKRKHE